MNQRIKLISMALFVIWCLLLFATIMLADILPEERLLIEKAIPNKATATPKKPRKLLICNLVVGRTHGPSGHASIPYANLALKLMGQRTGAYEAIFSNDTLMFTPEYLQQFDAICFNNTYGVLFTDSELRKSFLDFVKSGKGFIGIHGAAATFCKYPVYNQWPDYGDMLGGYEDGGHPWRDEDVKIKLDDPGHPLNAAFKGKGFEVRADVLQFRHGYSREKLRILFSIDATDDDFKRRRILPERMKDRDLAQSWIRSYGKGRVFYCALGHFPSIFWNPALLQHYLDGIQFALGDLEADTTPSLKPRTIENILNEIATYDYGNSRLSLTHLSDLVRNSLSSPTTLKGIEKNLLTFLRSDATLASKQYVCRELCIIGSEDAVPTLGEMLRDPETSDMARDALEAMPWPSVDTAFRKALMKTTGKTRIGIITSLGQRGDSKSVPNLSKLILDPDQEIAISAVSALGEIGGSQAAASLNQAKDKTTGKLRLKLLDAYLRCADQFLTNGKSQKASAIYKKLCTQNEPAPIRVAALKGRIAAEKNKAATILLEIIKSKDPVVQSQAIVLTKEFPDNNITKALVKELPNLNVAGQIQLLSALADRNDPTATPAFVKAYKYENESVRIAALNALGKSAGASGVMLLAEAAASTAGEEQEVARENLCRLKGSNVDQTILDNMSHAAPDIKVELIRSTVKRGMYTATETLLKTATDPDDKVRVESFRALATLADPKNLLTLVDLLIKVENEIERNKLEKTVVAVAKKISDESRQSDVILAALSSVKDITARGSLLSALGSIGNDNSLPVLQNALNDPNEKIKNCAIHALSNWPRPAAEPMTELLRIAQTSNNNVHMILAIFALLGSKAIVQQQKRSRCIKAQWIWLQK